MSGKRVTRAGNRRPSVWHRFPVGLSTARRPDISRGSRREGVGEARGGAGAMCPSSPVTKAPLGPAALRRGQDVWDRPFGLRVVVGRTLTKQTQVAGVSRRTRK